MSVARCCFMDQALSRVVAFGSVLVAFGALATSCAHPPTDRVLEPSGAAGSSSSPPSTSPDTPLNDGGTQIEPVATALKSLDPVPPPPRDYHALRSPELGQLSAPRH